MARAVQNRRAMPCLRPFTPGWRLGKLTLTVICLAACGGGPVEVSGTGGGGGGSGGASGGGSGGGTASGGGRGDGSFCAPCVESADCAAGAMCLGALGHCGSECSMGESCSSGATCQSISGGKIILGVQCLPASPVCDVSTRVKLGCADTWANWAGDFFATQCRSCHRHDTEFGTEADVLARPEIIRLMIESRSMPPAVDLGADRRRVLEWLSCAVPPPPATPAGR